MITLFMMDGRGDRYYLRDPYGEVANFLNQDIIITGLPAGCVGHDIHFTGFRGTDIIVLGKCSKPSYMPEI